MFWKRVLPCLVLGVATAMAQSGGAPGGKSARKNCACRSENGIEPKTSGEKPILRPKSMIWAPWTRP